MSHPEYEDSGSFCIQCAAPVIQATRIDNGEQMLVSLEYKAGWQLKYSDDPEDQHPRTGVGRVRTEHVCTWEGLEARNAVRFQAIAVKVGHYYKLFQDADEEIKPFEVECPQCSAPAGEPCNNMSPGRSGKKTKHPHQPRRDAGIAAQGYELVKLYGYQWIGKSEDVRKFLER